MSFGRPPSISGGFQVNPPDRGSFPLDHDGECKEAMMRYLDCLRKHASASTECRHLNRDYLGCRMKKGLMEPDEWKNLGLSNLKGDPPATATVKAPSAEAPDGGTGGKK